MKKIVLFVIAFFAVVSSFLGLCLIRFAKTMEDWEASWDEEIDERDND